MSKHYFPIPEQDEFAQRTGFHLDWRASIALDLIERFGVVAGTLAGEDSQGRAQMGLQPPREVVERALEITDIAVAAFEERGWIKPVEIDPESLHSHAGRLEGVRQNARYAEEDKRAATREAEREFNRDWARAEAQAKRGSDPSKSG